MNRQKLLGLSISIGSVIIFLTIIEVFLRFFAPVPDPYVKHYLNYNQYIRLENQRNYKVETELEAELPGSDGQKKTFSTNNMGFRGDHLTMPKPDNEFRIFMLGASNALCFYQDDSESIDAVLQRELSSHAPPGRIVKVYNAGQPAAHSDDIISMIVHRIVHLEPDMIVLFDADLYRPLINHDYLHFLKDTPKNKFPLIHFLATEFQIPRRIYYALKQVTQTDQEFFETVSLKSQYKKAIDKLKKYPVSDIRPKTDVPSFSKNLLTIIGIARAHDIKLIFMPPQSTWNSTVDPETKKWHWALFYGGTRYREDYMEEALNKYNDAMRRLAAEHNVPIFDLPKIIPKSTEYFYDDAHFNAKGAAFAGRELASFIVKNKLLQ